MQRVLITGGAGFIGSHLAEALVAAGCDVLVIDDLSTGSRTNLAALNGHPRFHFTQATILDPAALEPLVLMVAPLAPHLAERAVRLGRRAVAALPEPAGYLGVDVVLGTACDGRSDVVVEVNPRLTTSYVGLRAAAAVNLAAAMLDAAQGRVPRLSFRPVAVEFDPDGTVRERSEPS